MMMPTLPPFLRVERYLRERAQAPDLDLDVVHSVHEDDPDRFSPLMVADLDYLLNELSSLLQQVGRLKRWAIITDYRDAASEVAAILRSPTVLRIGRTKDR